MKYIMTIFKPGLDGYHRKTNEPLAKESSTIMFEAFSNTDARNKARELYKQTQLKEYGHYNIEQTFV